MYVDGERDVHGDGYGYIGNRSVHQGLGLRMVGKTVLTLLREMLQWMW